MKKEKKPKIKKIKSQGLTGWICPKCGQVWAIWVDRCNCSPLIITRTSTSSAHTWSEINYIFHYQKDEHK